MQEKLFIKNRKGQRLAIVVEKNLNPRGLVFVMHGFSWFKEQPEVRMFAEVFKQNGFTVITFDTTNTFGESEGRIEDLTLTGYYEDLEDVISWSASQGWYEEPFWLAGHSLGAMSVALYAEKYPKRVKGLAPISTVVSGKLDFETHKRSEAEELKEWEETGWLEQRSRSRPDVVRRIPWSHMEDKLQYDLLPHADKLIMPVLMIVGEKDERTPPEHQKIFFDKLSGKKEFHIINNAPHALRELVYVDEIKKIFDKWIKSNL